MFSFFKKKAPERIEPAVVAMPEPKPAVEATGSLYPPPVYSAWFNGEKFPGGLGPVALLTKDYWVMRERSSALFTENLYARGLIRRLVTNEINTGLAPEAQPDTSLLGLPEDSLDDWTEENENRFAIWGKNARVCDFERRRSFGALQREARREALISGDILVTLVPSQATGLPQIRLISGALVQTPIGGGEPRQGNEIKHGVEINASGAHVAYHVKQKDLTSRRIPAYGERSGRRLAWLMYGCDKRMDEVRGEPLLSLVLQSLKEVDRYRDSAQRKAVINSILAMFIQKEQDKPGTLPITGGATLQGDVQVTDSDGGARNLNILGQHPGLVIEELQTGEKPVAFGGEGTDVNFGPFEEAVIQSVAWANEIPPEILRLAFSNNYSASQAAINEFKIYLNLRWEQMGEDFCQPIYQEWLVSEVMRNQINAPGLLEAWRNLPADYVEFGAWVSAIWYGSIKPSTDMLKQAKASQELIDLGLTTREREARITTGTKYSKNAARLKKENALLAEANRPLAEFKQEFGEAAEIEDPVAAELDRQLVEALARTDD